MAATAAPANRKHPPLPPSVIKPPSAQVQEPVVEKPKAPLQPPQPTFEKPPMLDGRQPQVGDLVLFWILNAGRLTSKPAWLYEYSPIQKKWTLNLMMFGTIRGQHDVPYSDAPEDCVWTWRDEPVAAVAGSDSAIRGQIELQAKDFKEVMDRMGQELKTVRAELDTLKKELGATPAPKA